MRTHRFSHSLDSLLEVGGGGVDELAPELGGLQQSHVGELGEVGAGGLADDVVLAAVGTDVRARLRVFQEVENERALAVVECCGVLELLHELLLLVPLALQVLVEVRDGFFYRAELVADKIVQGVGIFFRVQERMIVALGVRKDSLRRK